MFSYHPFIISYKYQIKEKRKQKRKKRFLVMRALRIHPLKIFPMYHMAVLTVVIMVCIAFLAFIDLILEVCAFRADSFRSLLTSAHPPDLFPGVHMYARSSGTCLSLSDISIGIMPSKLIRVVTGGKIFSFSYEQDWGAFHCVWCATASSFVCCWTSRLHHACLL